MGCCGSIGRYKVAEVAEDVHSATPAQLKDKLEAWPIEDLEKLVEAAAKKAALERANATSEEENAPSVVAAPEAPPKKEEGIEVSPQTWEATEVSPSIEVPKQQSDEQLRQAKPVDEESSKATPSPEQLSDPNFVFDICDVDQSGRLDQSGHEIKHALRAMGFEPNGPEVREHYALNTPVDKTHFSELLLKLNQNVPANNRIRCVLPHALRGMRLDQLEKLQQLFIDSKWLSNMCAEANKRREGEGGGFEERENLYAIDKYIVKPLTQPEGSSLARDLVSTSDVPLAKFKCSYAELLNPRGRFVHYFVSHYWGHPFTKTMSALKVWANIRLEDLSVSCYGHVSFWICLFALNQHQAQDEVGDSPSTGPFNNAILFAQNGAVMVVDAAVEPFSRIWCLFEVHRLNELEKHFELISEAGPLTSCANRSCDEDPEAYNLFQAVAQRLARVQAVNARSSNDDDRHKIFYAIGEPSVRAVPFEVAVATNRWTEPGRDAFRCFDRRVQSLLATPLLASTLTGGRLSDALSWCGAGASFGRKEIEQLSVLNCDVCSHRSKETNGMSLLELAAKNSNSPGLETLLEKRALLEPPPEDMSALQWSVWDGHHQHARCLLMAQANIETKNVFGSLPLQLASYQGHVEIVELLLHCRADIGGINKDGWTCLHYAVNGVASADVVMALLKSQADVDPLDKHWKTPFLHAILNRSIRLAAILLEAAVDIERKVAKGSHQTGATPIIIAAQANSPEILKLLLEKGAEVDAVTPGWLEGWPQLILVDKRSPDVCIFENIHDAALDEPEVRLTLSSHKDRALVGLIGYNSEEDAMDWGRGTTIPLCVQAPNGAIKCSYDGTFITSSHDRVLDVDNWCLDPGVGLGLVREKNHGMTRRSGGGRDFTINGDSTISPTWAPHLALGVQQHLCHRWSALHVAAANGHIDVVVLLVEGRANTFLKDEDDQTAFDLASQRRQLEVTEYLLTASNTLPAA